MPERIYKLQPDRTIYLRGFDGLGAAAAIHSATPTSFKVSGVFRDPADFAVLVLYDADNFFEHPRLKYLPDTNFSGLTLSFDVHYAGLMPLDSPKFPTIDWPFLDVIRPDGSTARIPLFAHAQLVGGNYTAATGSFVIEDNGLQPYDRITLWYLNFAFDYIVPVSQPLPTAADVAATLAAQINGVNWDAFGVAIGLQAHASGNVLQITAARPGVDGNMITVYAVAKNDRLRTRQPHVKLSGGSSDATWRITLNFDALGIPQIRQMWLTFAPALADGAAFTDTEWEATFTNWSVTGPESVRALQVAGPGSVRIEENDSWCTYTGAWAEEVGFYSGGFARRAAAVGDAVTVYYHCSAVHDLYIGTSLYRDRGVVGIRLDGDAETDLDCYLDNEPAVNTRRLVRSAVPAGEHRLTIRLKRGPYFYFDFLEAVVPTDVPDPLPPVPNLSPALDYSTDHTYKLPPARLLWNFDRLGFHGPINQYLGVFWWNQRKRRDHVIPSVRVAFGGQFLPGDQIFLEIGGQYVGKTVFPNESRALFAAHFAYFINATFVGVWAAASGDVLTITCRSAQPAYSFSFRAWTENTSGSTGTVGVIGSLQGGQPGRWEVDPSQTPPLNRAARDWHADFYRECQARGREVVTAVSMELVNPPAEFAARFPDGTPVETSVGFGTLVSTHCAFNAATLDFQRAVFKTLADLMADAGLTPELQLGEFCWWYFSNYSPQHPSGGMAYYDADTQAAAVAALGRPLHVFRSPDDDPNINGGADAAFLRNRLRDYAAAIIAYVRAAHANAKFEVLFPYDVNHPRPAGVHQLGGRLNRFVNLPLEWEHKASSGLDRFKLEALDFGAWSRDLNLVRTALDFALQLGWPRDSLRHLLPVFRPASAWQKEAVMALGEGFSAVNLWAFDHLCIYGLPLRPAVGVGSAKRFG
ncbi:MAG: hypothetical protein RMK57_06025 [Bryobacterales bacterium]|nr:hypothetical protein [Bryobacteraceae bacterium]MDW8354072.1 hypothetical protein [Bryobacterales bacterium]